MQASYYKSAPTTCWQLHRPEQQRACAMLMKKGHDFESLPTVQKVRFRRSAKVFTFTRTQLDQAWGKLDAWHGKTTGLANRQAIEMSASLTVTDSPVLTWDGLDVETDIDQMRDQLQDVLTQVRYRMARYL